MGSRTTILAMAAALALPAVGCGERVIDAERVEGFIRATPGVRVPIAAANCPADVALKEGASFECRVSYENGSWEAWTLEQLDGDGSVRVTRVIQTKLPDDRSKVRIIPANVEALIHQSATKPLDDVDCPDGVKVKEGATFECVARFRDGEKLAIEIVQLDDLGNVKIGGERPLK